jgi:curved DNA-binding protein
MRRARRTLNVKIPKGIIAGQRIRLEKQGAPGMGGGPPGDLYLQVEFAPDPLFKVRGRDIILVLPVTAAEAALGATVKTPTLGGAVDLKIPTASGSGKQLRLKGRGLPGKTAGDQYVELKIVMPPKLDAKASALYQQLADLGGFDPRANLGG